jgi:glycosyl transferase, family 25
MTAATSFPLPLGVARKFVENFYGDEERVEWYYFCSILRRVNDSPKPIGARQRMARKLTPSAAGQALLDTFEAVRIINLKSRSDRRREVTTEFARLGLAIDGARIKFHPAATFSAADPFPSIGARGCFHSHLEILEEAKSRNFANVLILEDDCDFVGKIEPVLLRATQALRSNDWDIFFGGHEDLTCDETSVPPIQMIKSGTWIRGTHFVAFQKKAIEAMVRFLRDIEHLADDPIAAMRGIDAAYAHFGRTFPDFRYCVAWPKLGYQRSSRTDIQEQPLYERLPLANSLLVPVRRLKRYLKKRST